MASPHYLNFLKQLMAIRLSSSSSCCIVTTMIHIQLYTYTYTCGNIVNTIMTNEHTSLEKYTSHTLFEMVAKGLCVRGELETEQTATYWSPVLLSLATLLSCSTGLLNQGSWGPIALCWVLVLSTASYLQLTDSNQLNFLSHRVISLFDDHLLPVSIAFAPNSTCPQSRLYPDIFDWMHLFLDQWLGRRSICFCTLSGWGHFTCLTNI